ncbi:dynein light chainflagellar outer arm [Aphelenchoides avenae]|nr:dynein light chainflagellar outer arm [Aphelenchus avenae]
MADGADNERSLQTFCHAPAQAPTGSKPVADLRFDTKSKVVVRANEMPPEMACYAVELADQVIRKDRSEADIAQHIKIAFDNRFPPPWHCIVGRRFSSMVSHMPGFFLYFFIGKVAVVLFKCKD